MPDPVLALDTGSPLVSVALARRGALVAARSVAIERSSARLLEMVREVLEEAGIEIAGVGGIAVLRGPGSFTGVRIGLATVLGFHQALGLPVTTPTSFQALAAAAPEGGEVIIAAVDALRGEWSAQAFAPGPVPRPLGEPELIAGAELPRLAAESGIVTGFGVSRLADLPGWPPGLRLVEPGPLAPAAARLAAAPETVWDPALLTHPLYSRPPAITPARPRTPASAAREA